MHTTREAEGMESEWFEIIENNGKYWRRTYEMCHEQWPNIAYVFYVVNREAKLLDFAVVNSWIAASCLFLSLELEHALKASMALKYFLCILFEKW